MAELKQLRSQLYDGQKQREHQDQGFLRQLSTLDFTAKQKESYSKRYGSTGQWLLDSPEFEAWLNSEDCQHSVLWYPGNPGVGKTVITSIAVNYVTEISAEEKAAVVYIYCDYANVQTSSVAYLLGSMIRQLAAQTSHARTIAELKASLEKIVKTRNMTEEELSSWAEILSRDFDVVYTFVDALDECPEASRDRLLIRLNQYSLGTMRVFLTSRLNIDVTLRLPHAIRAEIAAASEDIIAYVESKIHETKTLAKWTARDPSLKGHITHKIFRQADGMFLLAWLQVKSLGNQTSIKGVRAALEKLPKDLFSMYDQTIGRIRDQPEEHAKLGIKALSLICGATRPLEIDEVRHALAIEPGDTGLDSEALIDLDILLSATAGLVMTYQVYDYEQGCFRLVHSTLQEYCEQFQGHLLFDSNLDMARVCISYLSLNEFGRGACGTSELYYKRSPDFYFFNYAAENWTYHFGKCRRSLWIKSLPLSGKTRKFSLCLKNSTIDISLVMLYKPPTTTL